MSDDYDTPDTRARGRLPGRASDTLDIEVAHVENFPERTIAGRYRLVGHLGRGGAGVVFKAVDLQRGDDTAVAVKLLNPMEFEDATVKERFHKEVALTKDFDHPNLVTVYDFGTTERGEPYVVMEYVEGGALSARIYDLDNPLTFPQILFILRDIAHGVATAHTEGIVHRDLKPDNILLTSSGTAKVADFGLAREMAVGHTITRSQETVGTPYYMSPEQFRFHRVDERSDIYSLGIIAFEMANRKRPFYNQRYEELARAHMIDPLPPCYVKGQKVPKWFETFVVVCAEKSPHRRYQSMTEVETYLGRRMARMGFCVGNKGRLTYRALSWVLGDG